jgi:hypothetical protein
MSARRWNLFARELEDILATRNVGLGQLDDRAQIHREEVRRLIHSLRSPKHFPVLNTQKIERIIEAFALDETEILRLHTAILVTFLEKTLMERIQPGRCVSGR